MADNKDKISRLHDLLPRGYNTKHNPNWQALLSALGEQDQQLADLISQVRQQFFVKTASRPYLDKLGANNKVSRPKLVGMDDSSFRQYIPVLSYKPKQVKLIIDSLLDIFFFKESTTAYITSQSAQPFNMQDGWELNYLVDEFNNERIVFNSTDFTDISNATADEIVASINRQAQYSYATSNYDSITKNTFIRIFTNTIGSKGSIRILGGRANIGLRFNGFIDTAGNGANTQWTVSKIGDTVTFAHTGGTNPAINNLNVGDIVIIDIAGNQGSFSITNVDVYNDSIEFVNLFATTGIITQTNDKQIKFLRPNKYAAYLNNKRAMVWETSPGEIEVEMPTSPPVVKRSLKGSIHVNGAFAIMQNRDSNSSLTLDNARSFPNSGSFFIEPVNEIDVRWKTTSENTVNSQISNGRLQSNLQKYTYSSRTVLSTTGDIIQGSDQIVNLNSTIGLAIGQTVFMEGFRADAIVTDISGNTATISIPSTLTAIAATVNFGGNTLQGISPDLPITSSLNEQNILTLQRDAFNIGSASFALPHNYSINDYIIISDSVGATDTLNGTWRITNIVSPTQIEFFSYGQSTSGPISTPGTARVEKLALANSGSKIILTGSQSSSDTRIKGPYVWDTTAAFVLSSNTAEIQSNIQAGKIVRILDIGSNSIPNKDGYVMFDYGLNTQEGPVRYLYKPTDTTLAIDPSYLFKFNHSSGSSVTSLSHKGPHAMSGIASEYGPYITDPSQARIILQDLIETVKSAGIFVNFIIRFPEQLYGTLDVYNSGVTPQ